VAALFARNHPAQRAVVLPFGFASSLLTQLPATGNPSSALSATTGNPPSGLDSPLRLILPESRGDDAGTGGEGGSLDAQSLGVEVRSGTRQTDSTSLEADKRFVACRRDVYQSQGSVEISVSRSRFTGEYSGLYAEG
jgi:hypothetical protein